MLRPASRCVRRRYPSAYSSTPAGLGPARPHRRRLKKSSSSFQLRPGGALRASDRHAAAASLLSSSGWQSPPFGLGASQRMVLSTVGGSGGGDTAKEVGETAAVHGTRDEGNGATSEMDPKIPTVAITTQARRLLELAWPERKLLGGALGLLLGSTTISLAVPKVMGSLIDSVMQGSGSYTPWEAALILMGMFGAQSMMLTGRMGLMTVAGERVAARLRNMAFGSMAVQETAFFDRNRIGDLVNRLASDVLLVQGSVTTSASQGIRNGLMVIGCTGMLAHLSPELAIVSVAVFPPVAGVGVWFGRRMKKQQKKVQEALAGSSAVAEEVLSNIRTVRQFSAEFRETKRYSQKVGASYELARRVGITDAFFNGSMHFGGHASLCAVMALGGQQVATGALSVGDMTSFLLYSTFLAVNFGGLTGVYSQIMRALGASERVMAIISSAEGPPAPGHVANLEIAGGAALADKVSGHVVFKDVNFSYPSRPHAPVLGGMSLEVEAGSSLAIVGASGCGKSTVLRLLTRLYDPQSGTIELDGVALNTLEPRGLRDRIGVVEQEPVLFGGTVADNIRYGRPEASRREVEDAAAVANASAFIEAFPDGYDTQVGEGGVQMSGGQKQRIAIARAVLKDPAIMLLDEATSALDSESEHLVQAALERVTEGRTSLIVAHRLSTVRSMADKICVLNKGEVVEVGSYDELANKPDGHFRRLVQYQMLEYTSTLAKVEILAEPPPKPRRRFRPHGDGKRYVREVSRLGARGDGRGVLSLLRRAEEDGLVVNKIMYNATISALAKCKRWKEALSVLDRMGAKDAMSYGGAIEACKAAGKPDEAYRLLRRMMTAAVEGSVKLDVWCFNDVLEAFGKQGQFRRALSLFEVDMPKAGVEPDLRTWSNLVGACRAGGESGTRAVALVSRMRDAGFEPDVWCFNQCLSAASKAGEWELAFRLLEDMGEAGVQPDSYSYSAAMKACVEAEEWQMVPVILDGIREAENGEPPSVWHFNICIDAYGKSGEWQAGLNLLRKDMPAAGVSPDVASYASCMDAAGKAGEWEAALALWDELTSLPLKPTELTYNIAIDVCGKAGLVDRALALLAESRATGFPPSLISLNSAIDASARAGRWQSASTIFRDIGRAGLVPDAVSYTSVMAAFLPALQGGKFGERELDAALALVEEMMESGVPPANASHSVAITLCAAAGRHELAMRLFGELKRSGKTPNETAFNAALGSCARGLVAIAGDGDGDGGGGGHWETALELLDEMEASGVAPTVTAFNRAIRACCDSGRWDLGYSFLDRMRLGGIDPDVFSMNALIRGLRAR
eukprot:g4188.t1